MTYKMVATAVTLNDLEGHSPLADVRKYTERKRRSLLQTPTV